MATPTIPNGEEHFFVTIYEGNGAGQKVGKFVPFTDSGTILKSCIFERANNDSLSKTYSGAGTSQQTATISAWVKRGKTGNDFQNIFSVGSGNFKLAFNSGTYADALQVYYYTGSYVIRGITTRTFEDTTKWYHIVLVLDLNNDTQTDRWRLYVDGDRVTSFSTSVFPSNTTSTTNVGSATTYYVGVDSSSNDYDGYITEFNYLDGQALLPENFGETDTSTGRWVPSTIRPYPATTETITVTVVSSGGNKYAVARSGYNSGAGVTQGALNLFEGGTYRFDQSDSSNSGHPLRFSTTSDGTHNSGTEYTTGVTTAGTPGSSGAYTEITVASGAPTLYYYCSSHSGMGGTANTPQSYGVQGTRLEFGTSSAMGDDTSGNENDFGLTNIDATNQTSDSPTQNHAVLAFNPTAGTSTLSEGNLHIAGTGSGVYGARRVTFLIDVNDSNGYYFEAKNTGSSTDNVAVGLQPSNTPLSAVAYGGSNFYGIASRGSGGSNQYWRILGASTDVTTSVSHASDDVIGVAIKQGKIWFAINNTWVLSGDPSNGTNSFFDMSSKASEFYISFVVFQNNTLELNFGQRSFANTPPTGFVALQQDNLPETAKGISGFVWTKNRDSTDSHQLYDSSRGKQTVLTSDSDAAETTVIDGLQKFLKGGHSIEDNVSVNTSGESYVSWNWVGNGGTTVTNDASATGVGDIDSIYQANTAAGFSIVTYTGTGSAGGIAHGLGKTPRWIITKSRSNDTNDGFSVLHGSTGTDFYDLSKTNAGNSNTVVWNAVPTSTVFNVGTATGTNNSGYTYLAYCWAEIDGFSKFGKYTGNGSSDGTFVATNFSPSFVMIKRIDSAGNWVILDNKRNTFNPVDLQLVANSSGADATGVDYLDFLSNGFKHRSTNTSFNASGGTYIYMAFAEHPFVGDGTSPVTAR